VPTNAAAPPLDRKRLAQDLGGIVGDANVLWSDYDLTLYEYDGSIDKHLPEGVVLPQSAEQVAGVVKYCLAHTIPFTARGAGTGLSGGCIPAKGGVLITFAKMARILEVDLENLRAVVEAGLVNLHLSQAVAHHRLQYIPDPSSQKACTIGGNVGENSGGPHTLLHGVTTNHVLGLEAVLPSGEIVRFGSKAADPVGYDLTGLFVGSEGTLGIMTKALVRLSPLAESVKTMLAIFNTVDDAGQAVAGVVANGIIPAALEMMDNAVIRAIEEATNVGYPLDAGAVLIIELEGLREGMEDQIEAISQVCLDAKAVSVRVAKDEAERLALWAGRKGAFAAMGRKHPEYYVMDGVVPRSKLPQVLAQVGEIATRYRVLYANVFHAGDGNLHPMLMFDSDIPGQVDQVISAGAQILKVCADAGGSLTGEHGIGMEKKDLMPLTFSDDDVAVFSRIKRVFDPTGLCNPEKIFPTPGRCAELLNRPNTGAGW
jgi:glycolate oxidase